MQDTPASLQLLLETPLEEELYQDWANLLETTVISYRPTARHLALCFTILLHPVTSKNVALQSSCTRIILRTLKTYGTQPFRQALDFEPLRQKRRKTRHTSEDSELNARNGDMDNVGLATTDNLFARFSTIWEYFSCAYNCYPGETTAWSRVTDMFCSILEQDWSEAQKDKHDMIRTLAVQSLREGDEKRIDLRKIVRQIFQQQGAEPTSIHDIFDPSSTTLPKEAMDDCMLDEHWCVSFTSRWRLTLLLSSIAQTPALKVIDENELISTVADVVTSLSFLLMIQAFPPLDELRLEDEGNNRFALALVNSMLFRLASYTSKNSKPGDRLVDWNKIKNWSTAQARSTDAVEISKVEFLKVQLLLIFVTSQFGDPDSGKVDDVIDHISQGIDSVLQNDLDESNSDADNGLLRKTLMNRQRALLFVKTRSK